MMLSMTNRIKVTDHFLRRWKDRVDNWDCEERAEEFYGKPRHKISDPEWIEMVRAAGIDATIWKMDIRDRLGFVPVSGQIVVGCWIVLTRNGKAVTIKPMEPSR